MFLIYDEKRYPCRASVSAQSIAYIGLPDDFPAPVSGEITLCADDAFVLRKDNVGEYLRQSFEGGKLLLTNHPDTPEISGSTNEPKSDPQADTDAMLVDHEYRITLLELGLTE